MAGAVALRSAGRLMFDVAKTARVMAPQGRGGLLMRAALVALTSRLTQLSFSEEPRMLPYGRRLRADLAQGRIRGARPVRLQPVVRA
jgi:hypothetical protein